MTLTDEYVARLAAHITGHPDAPLDARHLAATRAVLEALARDGVVMVVRDLFGGAVEEGRHWYRARDADRVLWCETSNPAEVVRSVKGHQGLTLERLPTYIVRTPWEPWTPPEQTGTWRLEGYDTFDGEPYPLDGTYPDRDTAMAAARERLAELERTQPSASSGGQSGIQDRVYVVRPDGTRFRVQ